MMKTSRTARLTMGLVLLLLFAATLLFLGVADPDGPFSDRSGPSWLFVGATVIALVLFVVGSIYEDAEITLHGATLIALVYLTEWAASAIDPNATNLEEQIIIALIAAIILDALAGLRRSIMIALHRGNQPEESDRELLERLVQTTTSNSVVTVQQPTLFSWTLDKLTSKSASRLKMVDTAVSPTISDLEESRS